MALPVIRKRRSIRKFLDQSVEPDKIDVLLEAALRAPSSKNIKPWEFIAVTDKELLTALAKTKPHGSSFVDKASLVIVVCGEPGKSDMWVEDCSIATTLMLLAAEEAGLGACWVQVRGRNHDDQTTASNYVRELLGIPDHIEVEAFVAAGYPAESLPPHDKQKLRFDKVHDNRYGTKR